jgi:tRNA modification GTPase
MFSPDDTIVAVSTPPGRGGIGVVRISGPDAVGTARTILHRTEPLEPRLATVTAVVSPDSGQRVDRVLVTHFPEPASYTGEHLVEISGHGSPVLLRRIVDLAVSAGARLAEPGEFTLRAFLNGRIDLVQAEAVGDLIKAVTPLQARAAFDQLEGTLTREISEMERALFDLVVRLEASVDFPEEGYHFVDSTAVGTATRQLIKHTERLLNDSHRGRLVREGGQVVILGKPNVGKSTLFNLLLGAPRAIVTDVAGTTRDLLTETLELDGIPVTLVDTAGMRATGDVIESEGVSRARGALDVARVVILVLDQSRPLEDDDATLLDLTHSVARVVVVNKIDLPPEWTDVDIPAGARTDTVVPISLVDDGSDAFTRVSEAVTRELLAGEELRDPPAITNLRHIDLLERTRTALRRAADAADGNAPEELVLADLAEAQQALGAVTGQRTPDDVLNRIFAEFCIGK